MAYFGCSKPRVYLRRTQTIILTNRNKDADEHLCAIKVAVVPREEFVKHDRHIFKGKIKLLAEVPERIGVGDIPKEKKVQA